MILIYIYLAIGLVLAVLFAKKGFKQYKKLSKGETSELEESEIDFFNDIDRLEGFIDIRIMMVLMFIATVFGWVFMVSASYKGKKIL